MFKRFFLLALLSLTSFQAFADDESYSSHPELPAFIDEMSQQYQFDRTELTRWFTDASKKQSIIDAISRPAERTLTWAEYRKIFIKPGRIEKGVTFWKENQATLDKAAKEFGVDPAIIVAIIGVETYYGTRQGSYRVIDALSTLAFDYPPRSKFFRKELVEFLLLAREQKQDPLSLSGSYAGAMGYGQFIPSSYRAYAVDYDGDDFADIWQNPVDAIGSVANYFKRHGWKTGEMVTLRSRVTDSYENSVINDSLKPKHTVASLETKGFTPVAVINKDQPASAIRLEGDWGAEFWLGLHNFYVITRYNHSRLYAMAVWQLSEEIRNAYEKDAPSI